MNDTAEKSCWNITLWAVVAVLGVTFVATALSGKANQNLTAETGVSTSKIASN